MYLTQEFVGLWLIQLRRWEEPVGLFDLFRYAASGCAYKIWIAYFPPASRDESHNPTVSWGSDFILFKGRAMLQKIREKSQGVFAWVILLLICIPFALWGIQNYLGGGSETPVVSIGDKDFYQQDINRAYTQYVQNLSGMSFDEDTVKQQALNKLIRDEVLWQYVQEEGLVVTDDTARNFIKSLNYFQTDGKFDKKQYKALLGAQRMSSEEFVRRIKKALMMEQFQKAVIESGFATKSEIDRFFAIQNQKRDVEYVTVPLSKVSELPTDDEIEAYYQQHQLDFRTEERVAIEYVELALDQLAADVNANEEQLKEFYQQQKDQYTQKERRKISHILFAVKNSEDEKDALERALQAKKQLKEKDFASLAAEHSDDRLTASKGGDLGLFNAGIMEPAFDQAAASLKLGEVSDPVRSSFGYHLIKVTELVPGQIKPYDSVKDEIEQAYRKAQAENRFYELGEILTEVSYENPDSLQAVADALGVQIKTTGFFTRGAVEGIAAMESVRNIAFSEDVLKGNNSEPVELGAEKLVVLRMREYKPAQSKDLNEVKDDIIAAIRAEKASKLTAQRAAEIKTALLQGQSLAEVAEKYQLKVNKMKEVSRNTDKLAWPIKQAIFKAAKPQGDKPSVIQAADADGSQTVISVVKVSVGVMSENDRKKLQLAEKNIANALSQATFSAVMASLEAKADISIHAQKVD